MSKNPPITYRVQQFDDGDLIGHQNMGNSIFPNLSSVLDYTNRYYTIINPRCGDVKFLVIRDDLRFANCELAFIVTKEKLHKLSE